MSVESRKLLHRFEFSLNNRGTFHVLQGSDHHVPLNQADTFVANLIQQIQQHKSTDLLILNGDLLDTRSESSQKAIGDVLRIIAPKFDGPVIYVPGNNDLRGCGNDAWSNFGTLPDNVYAPLQEPTAPIILPSRAGQIVIGNIFYDFDFLDPRILGLTREDIYSFYKTSTDDGEYLLEGKTGLFPTMTDNLARAITPDVSILITHCLPHPSLVTFRVAERSQRLEQLERELNIPFVCDPEGDAKAAKRWSIASGETYRNWWNKKSLMMGSNVLSHQNANLRDGLVVFFGHNHRAEDRFLRLINGKRTVFCSYQYPHSVKEAFKWQNQGEKQETVIRPALPVNRSNIGLLV